MKVNTWVYKDNQEVAKKLLKKREWGKFVNQALEASKTPENGSESDSEPPPKSLEGQFQKPLQAKKGKS